MGLLILFLFDRDCSFWNRVWGDTYEPNAWFEHRPRSYCD